MKLRNWIERAIGKQFVWGPCKIGRFRGQEYYHIDWTDGTEGNYWIDFEEETIEEIDFAKERMENNDK